MKALNGKGTHSISKLAYAICEVCYCYYNKCSQYCQKVKVKEVVTLALHLIMFENQLYNNTIFQLYYFNWVFLPLSMGCGLVCLFRLFFKSNKTPLTKHAFLKSKRFSLL